MMPLSGTEYPNDEMVHGLFEVDTSFAQAYKISEMTWKQWLICKLLKRINLFKLQ